MQCATASLGIQAGEHSYVSGYLAAVCSWESNPINDLLLQLAMVRTDETLHFFEDSRAPYIPWGAYTISAVVPLR